MAKEAYVQIIYKSYPESIIFLFILSATFIFFSGYSVSIGIVHAVAAEQISCKERALLYRVFQVPVKGFVLGPPDACHDVGLKAVS